jgi:hypothetical protein
VTKEELEAAHCWEADDRVPGRPEMTEFRRALRYHQARWRESQGHPIGTQPIAPRTGQASRPVGSRLPLDYAGDTGANFVTVGALAAVEARTSVVEPHQTLDHQRLWADLLWSPTLAFNLFGGLGNPDRVVHGWWPDVPGKVCDVRFVHSPGRLDPSYINSLRAFDAAFVLDCGGIVAVDVKYHERMKPELPRPENLRRYLHVAKTSGAFEPKALDSLEERSPLAVMWLEHLLLLSMLQHESGTWSWGRYVVIYPAGNVDMAEACARYRMLLADDSTFASMTLEELLGNLPRRTAAAVRARYLPGGQPARTRSHVPGQSR